MQKDKFPGTIVYSLSYMGQEEGTQVAQAVMRGQADSGTLGLTSTDSSFSHIPACSLQFLETLTPNYFSNQTLTIHLLITAFWFLHYQIPHPFYPRPTIKPCLSLYKMLQQLLFAQKKGSSSLTSHTQALHVDTCISCSSSCSY